jgi:hypothetical protein
MSLGNDQEGQPDNEDQVLKNAEMLFPFALHIFPGDDARSFYTSFPGLPGTIRVGVIKQGEASWLIALRN